MGIDRAYINGQLSLYEGVRLKVYDDATGKPVVPGYVMKGHPTIGKGRALDTNGITEDECELLFSNSVQQCIDQLEICDWYFDQVPPRQEALVMMCYQIGIEGLKRFKKMITALRIEDFEKAADEAMSSEWARNHHSRASDMSEIIRSGKRRR